MYKVFEQFSKPDRRWPYEEKVEHERQRRWYSFKRKMENVYDIRGNRRTSYIKTERAIKDQVESINNKHKFYCFYTCCIGNETHYCHTDIAQNYPSFETIYKTLQTHGIEEGLIRTFEQNPECVNLYRDAVKYYKLTQAMEPRLKDHDMINRIYEIIWSNKSMEPAVVWVHRGVIQVHQEMSSHCYLIAVAIVRLRRNLGKKSLLLSRLHGML